MAGFVYENDEVRFVGMAAGRVLYVPSMTGTQTTTQTWVYEYHYNDHQGNLRMTFREGTETKYTANLENTTADKQQGFEYDNAIVANNPAGAGKSAKLNTAQPLGMVRNVAVSKGDVVTVKVKGYYSTSPTDNNAVSLIATLGANQGNAQTGEVSSQNTPFLLNLGLGITPGNSNNLAAGVPNGYLKAVFFKKDGTAQAAQSSIQYLQNSPNLWQDLEISFTAQENGYLQVYVANQSDTEVYFDEMEVAHTPTLIAQENHYYPFGMNMVGIEKAGINHNPYQYNQGTERETSFGLHWDETPFRRYDAQLGRFHGVDALAEKFVGITPYQYAYNNPVMFNDPSGLAPERPGDPDAERKAAYNHLIYLSQPAMDQFNHSQIWSMVDSWGSGTGGNLGTVISREAPELYEDANANQASGSCCWEWLLRTKYGRKAVKIVYGGASHFAKQVGGLYRSFINWLEHGGDDYILPLYGPGGPGWNPNVLKEGENLVLGTAEMIAKFGDLAKKALEGNDEAIGALASEAMLFWVFKRNGRIGIRKLRGKNRRRFFRELWENNNPRQRGNLIENTYRHSKYKKYENVGALEDGFFPTVDFYHSKRRLAVSVKSTNARRGSNSMQSLMATCSPLSIL